MCLTDSILSCAVGSSAHGKIRHEMPLQVDRYWLWHVLGALGTLAVEPEWTSELQVGKRRPCSVAMKLIHSCCYCEAAPWCCQTFCWTSLWTRSSSSVSGTVEVKHLTILLINALSFIADQNLVSHFSKAFFSAVWETYRVWNIFQYTVWPPFLICHLLMTQWIFI